MSNREFTATRTMLANAMATAGAELLEYMGTSAALAAIPHSEPPRYVVAGTLAEIVKLLPGAEAIRAITAQDGNTILEGLTHDGWLVDGGLIYRLNDEGFNFDEINVTMVNGSRDPMRRHDAAVELLATMRESDAAPVQPLTAPAPLTDLTVEELMGALKMANERLAELTAAPAPQQSDLTDEPPHDITSVLREYAANPGYSHNDYADTMRQAADCIASLRAMIFNYDRAKAAPAAPVQTTVRAEVIERFADYSKIAHLIGSIFFDGEFKAETFNERELEALLVKTGHRYASYDEIGAFRADDLPIEFSVAAPVQAEQAQAEPSEQDVTDLVDAILANLDDRKGVLADIDEDIMQEICDEMAATIKKSKLATPALPALPALPAQAEQAAAVRAALQPFADLAELFDDDNRGSNMPGADADPVMQWPRMHKDYVLTVGHLRAARNALAAPSTATSNDTAALGDTGGDRG